MLSVLSPICLFTFQALVEGSPAAAPAVAVVILSREKEKKKRRQPGRMSSGRVAQCRLFVLYPWSDNCQLSPVAAVSARGPRRFVYVCVAAPAHWQRKQLYHGAPWMLTSGCCPHCACACAGATQQTVAAGERGKRSMSSRCLFGIYRLVLDMRSGARPSRRCHAASLPRCLAASLPAA